VLILFRLILVKKLLLIFILLFSCNISFSQNSQYKNGAIYGRVTISEDKTFNLSGLTILIEETNQNSMVDQNGFYYFTNVKPGNYNLVAIKYNLKISLVNKVIVSLDSISIVPDGQLYLTRKDKNICNGIKIKKTNFKHRGILSGFVYDNILNKRIPNAYVFIKGTFWGVQSDSNGAFKLNHILPGEYTIISGKVGYHKTLINRLIIKNNLDSYIEISSLNNAIPESIIPFNWKTIYKNTK